MLGVGREGEKLKRVLQEMSQKLLFGHPDKQMLVPNPPFSAFTCLKFALIFGQVKI